MNLLDLNEAIKELEDRASAESRIGQIAYFWGLTHRNKRRKFSISVHNRRQRLGFRAGVAAIEIGTLRREKYLAFLGFLSWSTAHVRRTGE